MARLYSNENFPVQTVRWLRRFGHEVLTSLEAGKANQAIPDEQVLSFAAVMNRILITQKVWNRATYRNCCVYLRSRL